MARSGNVCITHPEDDEVAVSLPAVSLTSSPTLMATLSPKFSVESLRNFTTMETLASTEADEPVVVDDDDDDDDDDEIGTAEQ